MNIKQLKQVITELRGPIIRMQKAKLNDEIEIEFEGQQTQIWKRIK